MSILVCIPTYNEKENIAGIIAAVLAQGNDIEVLIIDDNSPDGTAAMVESIMPNNPRIHLLKRPAKLGLGTAYLDGFKEGLKLPQINYFMQMDADFSHDPKSLKDFRRTIKDYDLVIGSRYINGITIVNWPLSRLMLSYLASVYVRFVTRMPVMDPTGGFKCFRREVIETLNLDRVKSNGYAYQIEMSFYVWRAGYRIKEIPIIFEDRRVGISKLSRNIIWEAIWVVWKLFFRKLFGLDKLKKQPA